MFVDVCERFKHFKNKNFFQVLIFSFSIKKIQNISASSGRHHQLLILLILWFYSFCLFVFFFQIPVKFYPQQCGIYSQFWDFEVYIYEVVLYLMIFCFPLFYSVLCNRFFFFFCQISKFEIFFKILWKLKTRNVFDLLSNSFDLLSNVFIFYYFQL